MLLSLLILLLLCLLLSLLILLLLYVRLQAGRRQAFIIAHHGKQSKIEYGDAGKLGKYDILSVLPDKFARFLYEFHDFRFSSLDLPPLPADRSDFDVHGAIDNDQV